MEVVVDENLVTHREQLRSIRSNAPREQFLLAFPAFTRVPGANGVFNASGGARTHNLWEINLRMAQDVFRIEPDGNTALRKDVIRSGRSALAGLVSFYAQQPAMRVVEKTQVATAEE